MSDRHIKKPVVDLSLEMQRQKGVLLLNLCKKVLGSTRKSVSATGFAQGNLGNTTFAQLICGRTIITENVYNTVANTANYDVKRAFNTSSAKAQQSAPKSKPTEEVKYLEAQPLALDTSIERFPISYWKLFYIIFIPDALQCLAHGMFYAALILGMCEFLNLFL
eukprot:TRINITY_DN1028_c0_g2_i1.p3 TRINITY_DN1028_c0_g2~~TRINITY_DN1028_c0_g2_i1.p3  ORF type:complete len:164 (-),score=9.13 TRINITY_DN1028_c0_g2_i1:226-717(-)